MKYVCKICGQIIDNNEVCPFCGSDSSKIEPLSEEPKKYRCLNCGHELDNNKECPFCGATGNLIFDISSTLTEDDNIEEEIVEPVKEKPVFEFCEGDDCCCDDEDDEFEEEHHCCSEESSEHTCCCHDESLEDSEEHHCCCEHENNDENDHCCCHNHEEEITRFTTDSFLANHEETPEEEEHECHHCGRCQEHQDELTENVDECSCDDEEHASDFEVLITDLLTVYGHLYITDHAKAVIFKEYLDNFLRELAVDFEGYYDLEDAYNTLSNNTYFKEIIKQFKK